MHLCIFGQMSRYSGSQSGIDSCLNSDEARVGYKECVNTKKGYKNVADKSHSQ